MTGNNVSQDERVVITGLGTVNALGTSAAELACALQEGKSGIGPVTLFNTESFRTHNGAEIRNFFPRNLIPPEFSLKRLSRADLMALAATMEALRDAGYDPLPDELGVETGVIIGGGSGGEAGNGNFFP